jgi:1-deoxy-D-xylulose-5-phosphate reductoisomerase
MNNNLYGGAIAVLGSTGSIGTQTLDVAERLNIRVSALAAFSDSALIESQARRFRPDIAALFDEKAAADLKIRLADTGVKVLGGEEGVIEAASGNADKVVSAIVGIAGLKPTLAAIRAGKDIALANKETLVCAGELVKKEAAEYGAKLIPVDSEHSAIYRCIAADPVSTPVKIVLTASGGPFFGRKRHELRDITAAEALRHPSWSMGPKITVDSATMMNKGLEIIEAAHLFNMAADDIEVVIHPQSVIHSLVEYRDGAMLAQLGVPDMRTPICYALIGNGDHASGSRRLSLPEFAKLTFFEPDYGAFPAPLLARRALSAGGTAPAVLNGANEAAVRKFLEGKIGFLEITSAVERVLDSIPAVPLSSLETVFEYDAAAREAVASI